MPRHFSRVERVADLIQTTLAGILQEQMKDIQGGMITITSVTVSPDFSHAKVFVSVLEEEKVPEAIDELNQAAKHLRHELAHQINLRKTPVLKFIYDDSTVRGSRISSLINDALKDSR